MHNPKRDELRIATNALRVLEKRYLLRDSQGKIIETPKEMFRRVARNIAKVDMLYNKKADIKKTEQKFYEMMASMEFMPNTPTLMNAGTMMQQLSACFVLPIGDSLESIFTAVKDMAVIHQSGGGTGFSFSDIREKGEIVQSTKGVASGPVSFMKVFDITTQVIKQGGKRRGANMGILRVDHPDVMEFISAKRDEESLRNFNISVSVTDKFMKDVEQNKSYNLVSPKSGKEVQKVNARDVFRQVVTNAWQTGDPGVVFIDEINRNNPTPALGEIESTNPCGELPLLPYESCNLGSINLSKFVKKGKIDFGRLKEAIHLAVHFLDNVIDANEYPLKEIEEMTKNNRKIGLGIMGFAEMLILLGIPYDSALALKTAEKVMKFVRDEARNKSMMLAKERGVFPNYNKSVWFKKRLKLRNATLTTIAPTGSISIIAGCSSSIEPLFAVSFIRNILEGTQLLEVNPIFEHIAREKGFYSKQLMKDIAKRGVVDKIKKVPDKIKRLFVTAFDISPEWHVKMQAAFQKYTDNAVSKTINFKHDASVDDVEKAYKLAFKLKCKGITVFRYGSKREQVLYIGSDIRKARGEYGEYVSAGPEYSGGCPDPYCHF